MSKGSAFTTFFIGGAWPRPLAVATCRCTIKPQTNTRPIIDVGSVADQGHCGARCPGEPWVGLRVRAERQAEIRSSAPTGRGRSGTGCTPSAPAAVPTSTAGDLEAAGPHYQGKGGAGEPREVKLVEQAPTKDATIDTSGKSPKGGWTGSSSHRFATEPDCPELTSAHIEPVSQDAADVKAARTSSVTSPMPVDIPCGVPTEVTLTSTAQHAQGNLVVDSNNPAYPHWTTRVVFAPK